jgi:transglutaminase superfamily protein
VQPDRAAQTEPAIVTTNLLRRDVHVCVADDNVIFLDLRHDKYVGLDAAQTSVFCKLMNDGPVVGPDGDALVTHLLEQNLLTQDPREGRALKLTEIARPTAGLVGFEYDPPCEVRWHHVLAFAAAYFEVTASLRFRSLAATVATACRRREAAANRSGRSLDVRLVHALVLAFRRLRPLFYRGRQQCLLDSLVLTAFLAKYRVFPHLVIGVMLAPFGGHCWVQYDDLVLNDRFERVARYTPIMSA